MAAGGVMMAIPLFALFLLVQKSLVTGLTAGAVKGDAQPILGSPFHREHRWQPSSWTRSTRCTRTASTPCRTSRSRSTTASSWSWSALRVRKVHSAAHGRGTRGDHLRRATIGAAREQCRPEERDIAMVFQSYALYPHMSVADNMAFGLLRKIQKDEIRARGGSREILGIEAFLGRKPGPVRRTAPARRSGPRYRPRPRSSSLTSRSRTSTPSSACRCAPRSASSTFGSGRRPSTSPTTRSKP